MIHSKKIYISNKRKVIIIISLLIILLLIVIETIQFLYFYEFGISSFIVKKLEKNNNSIILDLDVTDSCGFIQRYTTYQKDDENETLYITLYKDIFKAHPEFFGNGNSNYIITIDNLDEDTIQQIEVVQIVQYGEVMEFKIVS